MYIEESVVRFRAAPTFIADLTLDDLVACLSAHPITDGILLMGSTGTAALGPASDYDLLLVLNAQPVSLQMVTTWVGQRLTEVYCTMTDVLERIVARPTPWTDRSDEGTVLRWLQDGRIAFDRRGDLSRLQADAQEAPVPSMPSDHERYEAWRKIGYNVAHLRRYLSDPDPVAQMAVELRLLYSVAEVNWHYFTVRQLPWRGEKPAVRYWMAHDPDYLAMVQQFANTTDRQQKAHLYEAMAQHALAPVGGVWNVGATIITLGAAYGSGDAGILPDDEQAALAFWHNLTGMNLDEAAKEAGASRQPHRRYP